MHTQNGRSPRPRAPATFTLCEHQLTLIFFFLMITNCPLPPPTPTHPRRGPDAVASREGGEGAGAPASPALGKRGKVT